MSHYDQHLQKQGISLLRASRYKSVDKRKNCQNGFEYAAQPFDAYLFTDMSTDYNSISEHVLAGVKVLTSAKYQKKITAVVGETYGRKIVHIEVAELNSPEALWVVKDRHSQNLRSLQSWQSPSWEVVKRGLHHMAKLTDEMTRQFELRLVPSKVHCA